MHLQLPTYKQIITALTGLFLSMVAWANPVLPDSTAALEAQAIQEGTAALRQLMASNQANFRQGNSLANQYVFTIGQGSLPPLTNANKFSAVYGSGNPSSTLSETTSYLFKLVEIDALNQSLVTLNNTLYQAGKPLIYVGVDYLLGNIYKFQYLKNTSNVSWSDFNKNQDISQAGYVSVKELYDNKYKRIFSSIKNQVINNTEPDSYGLYPPPADKGIVIVGVGQFFEIKIRTSKTDASEIEPAFKRWFWNGMSVEFGPDAGMTSTAFINQVNAAGKFAIKSSVQESLLKFTNQISDVLMGKEADDSGLTGAGKLFFNDCKKTTGPFYGKGGKDLDYNLVRTVSEQLTKLMEEGTYQQYLKSQIIAYTSTKTLTNDDLKNLQQSLNQFKQAQDILFGFANNANINKLFDFLVGTNNSNCPPQGGLVPQSLWDNSLPSVPPALSLPFAAGAIDELALTIKSIASLPGVVWDFSKFTACWYPGSPGVWFSNDCINSRKQSVETFQFLAPFIPNPTNPVPALSNIWITSGLTQADVENWFDDVANKPKCTHYQMGKITFGVAALFVGAGEVEGVSWLGKLGATLKGYKATLAAKIKSPFITRLIPVIDNAGKASVEAKALIGSTPKTIAKLLPPSQTKVINFKSAPIDAKGIVLNSNYTTPIEGSLALKPTFAIVTEEEASVSMNQSLRIVNTLDNAELVAEDVAVAVQNKLGTINPSPFVKVWRKEQMVDGTNHILLLGQNESGTQTTVLVAIAVATRIAYEIKQDEDPTACTVCDTKSAIIQEIFRKVCCKAKNQQCNTLNPSIEAALDKICVAISDNTQLTLIANKLLDYTFMNSATLRAFLNDVNKNLGSNSLDGNLTTLDVGILRAWKIVFSARCEGVENCNENMKADITVLRKVKLLQNDAVFLNDLRNNEEADGTQALVTVVARNKRAGCQVCGASTAPHLRRMDEYLDDIQNFVNNYKRFNGARFLLSRTDGIKNTSVRTVEGAAFVMKVLNSNDYLLYKGSDEVRRFEAFYDELNSSNSAVDILMQSGKLVECKSWDENSSTFDDFVKGNNGSFTQFTRYLGNITDMNNLQYWFDAGRLSGTTTAANLAIVKAKFQALFRNQESAIFSAIWQSTNGLSQSLFGTRNRDDAEDFFVQTLIPNTSSTFYQFINVK